MHMTVPVIETSSGHVLKATFEHMVYAETMLEGRDALDRPSRLIPLGDVMVGDTVWVSTSHSARLLPTKVVVKRMSNVVGMYAPHTSTGNLIVDGVLASAYSSSIVPAKWVGDCMVLPFFFLYKVLGPEIMTLLNNIILRYAHDSLGSCLATMHTFTSALW